MTQTEFTSALTDDTWFDSPDELIAYRLPVVQYFISTYGHGMVLLASGQPIVLNQVRVVYLPEDFCLVNEAYLSILKMFNEGRLK